MSAKTIFKSILTVFKMIRGAVALLFALMWLFLFFWFTCGMLYVVALVLLEKFGPTKVLDIGGRLFRNWQPWTDRSCYRTACAPDHTASETNDPGRAGRVAPACGWPDAGTRFRTIYYLTGGLALIHLHHSQ